MKTEANMALATGLVLLWTAGEEVRNAKAANAAKPKKNNPKANRNTAPTFDGWATPKL